MREWEQKNVSERRGNVASTMASLEGLFATLVVDAYKGREADTFGVPGEKLHVDITKDKMFLFQLRG